ncbi:glycosyltransferase 61 family protein, partial [Falsirhodobacter sp. alg1]|uniref:glycosyltransferase 61 family protein n=1 Tax=Falsirhodobacter sp. alg1 TaxID=1472418 RepID=UPI00178CEA52
MGDAPILYQEDKYRILPVVCDRLGIDKNRLISIDEASDLNIQKALLPSHPPYYWNKSVFSFFQKISTRTVKDGLKVFISRRRSNRGPSNEDELETFLAERGFLVVYAE